MPMFEVQKFANGKWLVDTIYDDRAEATEAAKSLMEGIRPAAAVRVLTDDGSGDRVIFRQSLVDEANSEAARARKEIRLEAEAARARRQAQRIASRPPAAAPIVAAAPMIAVPTIAKHWQNLFVRLGVVIAIGAGAIEALHLYMSR